MNFQVLKKFLVDNAPAIFTGLAIAGTVETVYLTAKAVPEIEDKLYDLQYEKYEKGDCEEVEDICDVKLKAGEIVKTCWADCIPPTLSLTATIFFIIAANQAHIRREAGLAAICSFYESKHKDYKTKNRELFGEENDKKVEEEVRKDRIRRDVRDIYPGRAEEYLVYDEITRQYFYATFKEKEHAQEQLNRILGKESAVNWNYLLSCFKNANYKQKIGFNIGWFLDDTYAEYHYWNESFYGRPYAELTFEESGEVTDQQEPIYILRCSVEPMLESSIAE